MKLYVFGSGSDGNAYALSNGKDSLLIEAGINFRNVRKGIDFNFESISGLIISHMHGDHSKFINQYAGQGLNIFSHRTVAPKLDPKWHINFTELYENKVYSAGNFHFSPFCVTHDVPTFGFFIFHKDMGNVVFMTDSFLCEYKFPEVDHWIIEANYSDDLLNKNIDDGLVSKFMRNRLYGSHMEIDKACDFLLNQDLRISKNIVLIHLSSTNGDPNLFKKKMEGATGIPTKIAEKGLIVDLSINCF